MAHENLASDVAGRPSDIESRSFETITRELAEMGKSVDPAVAHVVKRVIHTTADFSFADTLEFRPGVEVVAKTTEALAAGGVTIVTDTNMALAGISKPALKKLGDAALCHMADPDVAAAAKANGTTRAVASMDKACELEGPVIFAIGNAPTALLRIRELVEAGKLDPLLVVGVPVGFVNVVEAKDEIAASGMPSILARGRKGGSTIAAAIMNAMLYKVTRA